MKNKKVMAHLANGNKLEIYFPKDKFIFMFKICNNKKVSIKGDFYLN
jgi:hypothetical protein